MSDEENDVTVRDKMPTINDVADKAGVSKRTVSRVINKSTKVNAKTRQRVEAVIEALNYIPNSRARGLAARRSYLIGLIYDLPTLFINDVQKGILNICTHAGYDVVVHPCEFGDADIVCDVQRFVSRSNVDGVIMLPPVSEIPAVSETLRRMDVPYVYIASDFGDEAHRLVVINYGPAVTDMTNHLVQLGHRSMGFVSGPANTVSSKKRKQAFMDALGRHGLDLPDRLVVEGAFTHESGASAAEKLLSQKERPTAIFAANDEMAFGVMNMAARMGISVPDDLSVAGFGGTLFATFTIPSLSTICAPTSDMASLAAQKLLAFINDGVEAADALETMVSPTFVPRNSTGPAPDH